ncbi:MAG: 3-oxoacyl-[acyl-carrier-protein] synthase 2 [Candidatus Accumulibacter adjunctus]|uniref:3-oxoacyl-[acyl-carrier-protein] synthase 2 n=1 Tax=Candidatus Accumulibacter adjunctus TaxID=1454001 RepID=A0A011M7E5_9PROT|nr:MAG: 3-oxoacyl-[acyl-carrier-protein] synthase 2 [Candidatus Accumulibacter adjunctus]
MSSRPTLSRPGLVSALGAGVEAARARLFAGDTSGMIVASGWLAAGAIARVGKFVGALRPLPDDDWHRRHASRNNQLLLAAFAQIEEDFRAMLAYFTADRIGVVLGTSTSGVAEGEAAFAAQARDGFLPDSFAYEQMEIGDPAVFLARHLGVDGPAYTVSTACTSGGKALASARLLIEAGFCDAVITGGVDSLCRLTVGGFAALESTSTEICQPLSRNRRGINIGEGAALFLMTAGTGPVTLLGVGESSDAHHISAPDAEGRGAEAAMRAALADAGLVPTDIGYLNLHATATPKNDAMESLAVARVFPDGVAASGTKPMTGHTLGAAGALEAAFCWLALTDPTGRLPPHVWDGQCDPELPCLDTVARGRCFAPGRRVAMSNSFAFGGNNLSLILGVAR